MLKLMLTEHIRFIKTMQRISLTPQYAMGFGHSSCPNLGFLRYLFISSNTSVFSGMASDDVLPFFLCFFLIIDSIHADVDDKSKR